MGLRPVLAGENRVAQLSGSRPVCLPVSADHPGINRPIPVFTSYSERVALLPRAAHCKSGSRGIYRDEQSLLRFEVDINPHGSLHRPRRGFSNDGWRGVAPELILLAQPSRERRTRFAPAVCTPLSETFQFCGASLARLQRKRTWP
jgi:hypothetical protein